MFLKKVKDKLYYYIVLKNEKIRSEYQGYVNSNQQQHKTKRLKSWRLLIKLNIKYRLLGNRNGTMVCQNKDDIKSKIKLPYLDGAESEISKRQPSLYFAKELLKYDVVSFDIFDTLILRPFAKPSDMFMVVGNKLNCLDFMRIRIEAEREARENAKIQKGNHEITIYDIYELIERRTGIRKEVGIKMEFETEVEFCFANPYMMRVFKILKEQNKEIIIVSDMYLPHDMMEQLLEKCGYSGYKKLFVSCDYGCNKRMGGLYKNVLNEIGKGKTVIHIGDNIESDINSAVNCGISTKYYKNVHEIGNQYRAEGMSELIGSLYSGIVNTHLHNGIRTYSPHYEYGFIYGGLYITGFCNWIYQKAKQENIDKILFLSRDGEIYQQVFNMMFKDMPNEYIYWSRIANTKYTIEVNREDFLTRVVKHKANSVLPLTISSILKSISLESIEDRLKDNGLEGNIVLVKENAKLFEQFFIDHWDEVVKIYSEETSQMYQLLKSNIEGCKKIAVIDVGWVGTGPLGIKYLIEEKWKINCKVSCWMAANRHPSLGNNINQLLKDETEPYIFSRMYNRNLYDVHSNTNNGTNCIYFELFTQACYPTFAGLDDKNNFKFEIPEVENYESIKEIHKGIFEFACIYTETVKENNYLNNIKGYDAYLPYRMIIRDLKFIKNHLSSISFARGVGGDYKNQKIETIKEILEQARL